MLSLFLCMVLEYVLISLIFFMELSSFTFIEEIILPPLYSVAFFFLD